MKEEVLNYIKISHVPIFPLFPVLGYIKLNCLIQLWIKKQTLIEKQRDWHSMQEKHRTQGIRAFASSGCSILFAEFPF